MNRELNQRSGWELFVHRPVRRTRSQDQFDVGVDRPMVRRSPSTPTLLMNVAMLTSVYQVHSSRVLLGRLGDGRPSTVGDPTHFDSSPHAAESMRRKWFATLGTVLYCAPFVGIYFDLMDPLEGEQYLRAYVCVYWFAQQWAIDEANRRGVFLQPHRAHTTVYRARSWALHRAGWTRGDMLQAFQPLEEALNAVFDQCRPVSSRWVVVRCPPQWTTSINFGVHPDWVSPLQEVRRVSKAAFARWGFMEEADRPLHVSWA